MGEDYDENEDEGFILSVDENGKPKLSKEEEFVQVESKYMDIIISYLDKNKTDFEEFAKQFENKLNKKVKNNE